AVDAEGAAAGSALGDHARTVRPRRAVVDRLPDIGLEGRDALAAGQVAEVHGVGLVRGQAVVAAVRVGGGDLVTGGAAGGRRAGDGSAARGRVVELAAAVGHDRRLAAIRAHVGDAVRR